MTANTVKTGAAAALGASAATAGRAALARPATAASAAAEFETTLLAVMFDQAMPRGKTTYGKGAGGDFARSQLCHELARSVTTSGGLGIARMLEAAAARRRD